MQSEPTQTTQRSGMLSAVLAGTFLICLELVTVSLIFACTSLLAFRIF